VTIATPPPGARTTTPAELGFIGLGIMGAPMARHLIAAGHRVHVHTRSRRSPGSLAARAASHVPLTAEAVERPDVVFLMLPTPRRRARCCSATQGVAQGLTPGKTGRRT
jgi:2-hydroxy-3-oxopropionate reductase